MTSSAKPTLVSTFAWPKPGGRTEVGLEALVLLRRLAVLILRPFTNLIRYCGVFATGSKFLTLLARPLAPTDPTDAAGRPRNHTGA